MTRALLILAAAAALAASGCQEPAPLPAAPAGVANSASNQGLTVELRAPTRQVVWGQTLTVEIVARNTTAEDIVIDADTGAEVYLRLWRLTTGGWEQVKRYPATPVMVAWRWTLPPGGSRSFQRVLQVERDWPTGEALRLTVELNGRPDVAPGAVVEAFPDADQQPASEPST